MSLDFSFILTIIGLIGTVVGLIIGIKSSRKKIPYYDISGINILSQNMNPSTTDHKELTITKAGFWNGGNETIRKEDIPKGREFTIRIKNNFNIINAELLKEKYDYSNTSITYSHKEIKILFDYLEKNAWCIIKITHTGNYSNCFVPEGKVIGGKELKRVPNSSRNAEKYNSVIFDYIAVIFSIIILALIYKYFLVLHVLTILGSLFCLSFIYIAIMRIFEIRLPSDLKKELGK